MRFAKFLLCVFLLNLSLELCANTAPVVSGVLASQRSDGSKLVDIYYAVMDSDADTLTVSLSISTDNGASFSFTPSAANLSGDIGEGIISGTNKHIVWNAGSEGMHFLGNSFKVKVTATEMINLTRGLVAYFPFNGNANDASGYNNHGTASNVAYTLDRFGRMAKTAFFNGSDSRITIPNQFYFHQSSDAILSFWMKRNDYTIRTIFWTKNDDYDQNRYHIFTGVNGQGFTIDYRDEPGNLYLDPSQGPAQLTVAPGSWAHICVCRTGNQYHLYQNGNEQTVITDNSPNLPNYNGPWRIGKGWYGNSCFWGSLDDIRIYNRALSAAEVSALYQEGGWPSSK